MWETFNIGIYQWLRKLIVYYSYTKSKKKLMREVARERQKNFKQKATRRLYNINTHHLRIKLQEVNQLGKKQETLQNFQEQLGSIYINVLLLSCYAKAQYLEKHNLRKTILWLYSVKHFSPPIDISTHCTFVITC